MGQEEVEFYRRLGFDPAKTVVSGPGGPYPTPKIETQESVSQRIRKLEEEIASLKDVTLGQRMMLDATSRAMLSHFATVQRNFEFLRVVGNDLHDWATGFLDEYNARHHPAAPILYPTELPPGFAFTPDETKVADKLNSRHQELLNENATLRREYDAIHAERSRLRDRAAYLEGLNAEIAANQSAQVTKPPAKKSASKKSASK